MFLRQRRRRPDRAVYVPRGRRSQTTPTTVPPNTDIASKCDISDRESAHVIVPSSTTLSPAQNCDSGEIKREKTMIDTKEEVFHTKHTDEPNTSSAIRREEPPLTIKTITDMADTNVKCEGSRIDLALNTTDKEYNEEKEFQRASKVNIQIKKIHFVKKHLTFSI